ncbi:DUF932 domain-containing protein [Stenotrophomonas sp. VV52]|uniref:DUF932 domain-containing protein n=1 Tax=Stenotrophomonas sp. VV52 TaxID=2066958 RepID=UPI00209BBCF4|nr:DUF932 domain-containing protein [Stenotrophomonas sp. VV52]
MHLVETMAYAGEKPWHGLGNNLAPQQPIEVWRQEAGMDWKIERSEVRYITGSNSVGVINAFPEQKVLYRSDSKCPLAVVSKRFQVVQPGEILEFYRDLTACSGFELETAGVLRGGRKFWALARTGQSTTLKPWARTHRRSHVYWRAVVDKALIREYFTGLSSRAETACLKAATQQFYECCMKSSADSSAPLPHDSQPAG